MSDQPLRLHLGDHFYGSGNIGDDLMLAGLLIGLGVMPGLTPLPGTPGIGGVRGSADRSKNAGDCEAPESVATSTSGRGSEVERPSASPSPNLSPAYRREGPEASAPAYTRPAAPAVRVTCCSMFADRQRGRFPQVTWRPYALDERANSIEACDAWVGGGGSPFQLVVGTWLLDHLAQELALCKRYGKPMYLIGVGANERAALGHPHARAVLEYASHVWTRDAQSTEWLSAICGPKKVTGAADLSHVAMRAHRFLPVERDVTGYVLNFEEASQFRAEALCELVGATPGEQRWLVQEVRELAGSERAIYAALPEECRRMLVVRAPDYAAPNWRHLVDAWGAPQRLLTSRYHGVIIGAWAGSEVLGICRSDKVRGVAEQLGVPTVETLTDAEEVRVAWERTGNPMSPGERPLARNNASTVPRRMPEPLSPALPPANRGEGVAVPRETLHRLASLAQGACDSLVQQVSIAPVTEPMIIAPNRATFASLDEMNSPQFRSFMSTMNAFAAAHGLRQFTNWTKIWEYPWLWHACLSGVPWRGARLIDLGSEISPMPWFLATLGASVRLVEVDPQWEPAWVALREKLAVDVEWNVVQSEKLPYPDGWADVVTSFSVIEHQPDKRAAVAEVARVLRSGGAFAVSFDICEPTRGMTFPEWNGRALTVREFEDDLWLNPAFGNTERPTWDWDLVRPFLEWHRTTAPHHNYVAAAAVLRKR